LNRHSHIDRAAYGHISDAPFNQWWWCMFSSTYNIISFGLTNVIPLFTNCGNPSVWNSRWIVAESISHLLILSLV
jgi:hypothetical protein